MVPLPNRKREPDVVSGIGGDGGLEDDVGGRRKRVVDVGYGYGSLVSGLKDNRMANVLQLGTLCEITMHN